MKIVCPHCGKCVFMNKQGRQPLGINDSKVIDVLLDSSTRQEAAKKLGCSRGYIYGVLRGNGLVVKKNRRTKKLEVIKI